MPRLATGQAFAPEALQAVWTQTRGQPWLVNALALGTCFKNRALRDDRSRTVTADDIAAARDELIVNRVTHLDYLADKLREDRVRRVIEPMLSGADRYAFTDRDIAYVRDLGLVARDAPLRVANPIYAEVLPRELAWVAQEIGYTRPRMGTDAIQPSHRRPVMHPTTRLPRAASLSANPVAADRSALVLTAAPVIRVAHTRRETTNAEADPSLLRGA